jgi:pimeloyl-ACP methyl ester carboxylesterase
MPVWEQRFRAPNVQLPDWSEVSPERLVFASSESGVWQVHVWDRASGLRRRVTDHPVGVVEGVPTLDGQGVAFWQDETGDESGRWLVQPFEGGQIHPFIPGVPIGWNQGLSQAQHVIAAAISTREGFGIWTAWAGEPAVELASSTDFLALGGDSGRAGLSPDGELLCLEHSEHGDLIHPALRVLNAGTGEVVGEQLDQGMALKAACWSPVLGDHRLVITHERDGEERPAIWNLATGERIDLQTGLEGVVEAADWWPDASALLIVNLVEGRHHLYRYEVATGSTTALEHEQGTIFAARVRPDGNVWYRVSSGARQAMVMEAGGGEVLKSEGERAPQGRPYVSWRFDNGLGDSVHGFHVTPEGPGPFPVMMFVHGGPTWLDTDRFSPEVQAYVDAGFAVGMVNYRGSIGYGREWRDVLIGNIGKPELEDVNAGLADLVGSGIADPARAVVGGWSWGGYTTLMELGKHPDLWVCGVAGVPVGDYVMSYADMSPELQAYDRALLGGAPGDVPELMADRNPVNFADNVRVPVLFIIGENDTRCPLRQAMAYVDKLAARDHPHEVYLFGTGHSTYDIDEDVHQQRTILDFLARNVAGVSVPGGA